MNIWEWFCFCLIVFIFEQIRFKLFKNEQKRTFSCWLVQNWLKTNNLIFAILICSFSIKNEQVGFELVRFCSILIILVLLFLKLFVFAYFWLSLFCEIENIRSCSFLIIFVFAILKLFDFVYFWLFLSPGRKKAEWFWIS